MDSIKLNGCKLSPEALNIIRDNQNDNNEGFEGMKEVISSLLIDIIQEGFGGDKRDKYIRYLADDIQLINSLKR